MRKSIVVSFLILASALTAACQGIPSHEETVVRTAYAKLAYLTQVGVIGHAAIKQHDGATFSASTLAQALKDQEVSFQISDVKVGNVSEIASVPWGDLVSPPGSFGHVLSIRHGNQTYSDNAASSEHWMYGAAEWQTPPSLPAVSVAAMLAMPCKTVIALGAGLWITPDIVYERYAAFTVTATFQGETVGPYKAIFFFGSDAEGREAVSPQDQISDAQALYDVISHPLYPSGLLRTHLRETKVVSDWLKATRNTSPSCAAGTGNLCCDGLKCGVADLDVANELAKPLPSEPPSTP